MGGFYFVNTVLGNLCLAATADLRRRLKNFLWTSVASLWASRRRSTPRSPLSPVCDALSNGGSPGGFTKIWALEEICFWSPLEGSVAALMSPSAHASKSLYIKRLIDLVLIEKWHLQNKTSSVLIKLYSFFYFLCITVSLPPLSDRRCVGSLVGNFWYS